MYSRLPVIAHKSGGPLESIVDGETGYLVDDLDGFTSKLREAVGDFMENRGRMISKVGEAGRKRVIQQFGMESFINSLEREISALLRRNKNE
jgi:alpha-1,3/alpha-1,6-mannosyltransferase